MRILVVRNDRLGDFMVTWPALSQLRRSWPEARIFAMVSRANVPVAELCPSLDGVLADPGPAAGQADQNAFTELLRSHRFDASITLISTTRIAQHLRRAGIPYRLVPFSKAASLLHTHRLIQRRSRSEKPEFAYNQDVVGRFLRDHGREVVAPSGPPYLRFDAGETALLREKLRAEWGSGGRKLVMVHPGTGGTAPRLGASFYARLCGMLRSPAGHHVVISAGPGEEDLAEELSGMLGGIPHSIYRSRDGLAVYARVLSCCDFFISGSTGTLHLAGALNLNTAGFYLPIGTATALRWQPVNDPSRHLAFSPPPGSAPDDASSIDLEAAATMINARLSGAA